MILYSCLFSGCKLLVFRLSGIRVLFVFRLAGSRVLFVFRLAGSRVLFFFRLAGARVSVGAAGQPDGGDFLPGLTCCQP